MADGGCHTTPGQCFKLNDQFCCFYEVCLCVCVCVYVCVCVCTFVV